MRYRINKTNYCDFNVFEDNKLAPRSYFIPYPDRESADKVSGKEKRYKVATSTRDHYVTITGIIESKEDNITLLEISSWGKKYYIRYDEYRNFVKKCDNFYFSNILYIKAY